MDRSTVTLCSHICFCLPKTFKHSRHYKDYLHLPMCLTSLCANPGLCIFHCAFHYEAKPLKLPQVGKNPHQSYPLLVPGNWICGMTVLGCDKWFSVSAVKTRQGYPPRVVFKSCCSNTPSSSLYFLSSKLCLTEVHLNVFIKGQEIAIFR